MMKLLRFIFRRVWIALITMFVLATATFWLMRAVPGDPLAQTKAVPAATRKNLEIRYGLDKPVFQQYLIQMQNIFLKGDLGGSLRNTNREVNEIIRTQFPTSASVGLVAVSFGTIMGLTLGTLAALYRNSLIDRFAMGLCVIGIALPSFIVAYILQYFLSVYPLNSLGFNKQYWISPAGWGQTRDYFLPAIALSLPVMAGITRLMRAQMVDVGFSDFVKTAKSKGVSTLRLVFMHQIRNAIMPILSIFGPLLAGTVIGSLIMEGIFGIPGLGRTYGNAITNQDYNVIMGISLFYAGFLIIMNVLVDILYGIVDPRIRVGN